MAKFAGKFDSAKQEWETPDSLYDPLAKEFRFTLDAAADSKNARCKKFFTKEQDGLKQDWGKNTVWLNPPYGAKTHKISDWIKKSYAASLEGATVVVLIPARTNTEWFHQYCLAHAEVRFVRGRPKFGGATHGLPQPLCLIIFRGKTMTDDKPQTTFRCGWCGMDFPTHFACGNHEQNCEVMQEEANKEVLKQDWRRYEEQEHEAGRI